ncbi:hypothetical protein PAL_GLEAN10004960 [Pteropus alecto]|uniref:Uncharacterized protein n=1 Tax=Pteropus alecto TaxID=9402 RepID=L5KKD8_PTEAL|nr:hypothetical protein PAL_GLEAN10004960 [Pteropus alecto]
MIREADVTWQWKGEKETERGGQPRSQLHQDPGSIQSADRCSTGTGQTRTPAAHTLLPARSEAAQRESLSAAQAAPDVTAKPPAAPGDGAALAFLPVTIKL